MVIELKNITKIFNQDTKLNFKDITFEEGKSYVVIGPSGCGKSTLLNLISGIILPDNGEILFNPKNQNSIHIEKLKEKQRDKFRFDNIGYIFQDYKLIEEFSVADNIELLNLNGKKYSAKKVDLMLERVKLQHKKKQKVKTLSGGEKQRVAIARALIKNPDIILADEPTESLNETLSHEIIELMTRLSKEDKKTVIMVTHDLSLTKYFDETIDITNILKGDDANA